MTWGTFHYEDDRLFYYSSFQEDHTVVETILKGYVTPDGNFWNPFPKEKSVSSTRKMDSSAKYDIMLSYCHQNKELCHRIYNRLLKDNYKVWIDLENMYGSTIERMADAIDNSDFILICMSSGYKSSNFCQLEAEYTFKSQRSFVPLIVENGYKPTGWLSMLVGLRMYVDFTKFSFDVAYDKLINELNHHQKERQ